jgi:hypothetical protein
LKYTVDPETRTVYTRAVGVVSFEDVQKHLEEKAADKVLAFREVLDASNASTTMTQEQVREIVSRIVAMMRGGSYGPTAVIAANAAFFGMARMIGILCEVQGGPTVAVFRTFNEAMDWLVQVSPPAPGS